MDALQEIQSYVPSFVLAHPILTFVVTYTTYKAAKIVIQPLLSKTRDLPGPESPSWFFGNQHEMMEAPSGECSRKWTRQYGGAHAFQTFMGRRLLSLSDPVALKHVLLLNAYDFVKPEASRKSLARILGEGILFVEGDDHQRQRKIMAPAFTNATLKDMDPIWWEVAARLRDQWLALMSSGEVDVNCFATKEAAEAYRATKREGEMVVDPGPWMGKATMDIIGEAGFGYNFDSLDSSKVNKLAEAYAAMLSPGGKGKSVKKGPMQMFIQVQLQGVLNLVPWIIDYIPDDSVRNVRRGLVTSQEESTKILDARKAEGREAGNGRDVLSLLLKSNQADAKLKMSDSELLGQMTTMILAGHETTATLLTSALMILTQRPDIQDKLRTECNEATKRAREAGKDDLDGEDLSPTVMPYVDAFTRECLRTQSPVIVTVRQALKDDLVPLLHPITLRSGKVQSHVEIKKDQVFTIPVQAANYNKEIFGEDADEFRPERWIEGHVGEKVAGPGVFSQLMTFLEGPRACIGYKLSIAEFKAILVTLVRSFEFEPREEGIEVERRSAGIVSKLIVKGEDELGFRVPVKVKLLVSE